MASKKTRRGMSPELKRTRMELAEANKRCAHLEKEYWVKRLEVTRLLANDRRASVVLGHIVWLRESLGELVKSLDHIRERLPAEEPNYALASQAVRKNQRRKAPR